MRCSLCGAEIAGQYARYEELDWNVCSACREAPACVGCGLPRAGRNAGEGEWCTRCVEAAPRCATCGRPALGSYFTLPGREEVWCERCMEDAPRCAACGRPALDGRTRDGRFFCRDCLGDLVETPDAYLRTYDRVTELLGSRLGLVLAHRPGLLIADRGDLASASGEIFPVDDLCGLYQRDESGLAVIRVLSHLAPSKVAAVLAHELAHAWQVENCPLDQGIRLREGFAEWVAWNVLADVEDGASERQLIELRSDEYGHGFRIFAGIQARQGTDAAIRYATSARNR